MEDFRLDIFIILVLLSKNDSFKNNYSLTRGLHWKFGILNDLELKKELLKKGLITCDSSGSMNFYDVTTSGRQYLINNFEKGKVGIYQDFLEEKDFIDVLFRDFF